MIVSFFFLSVELKCQENAAFSAMANASGNEIGHLSMYDNPAGLSFDKHNQVSMNYLNHHLIKDLNRHSFTYSTSNNKIAMGLLFDNFGDSRLQQNTCDLVYSQRFDPKFGLGIKLRLIHLSFSDIYGERFLGHIELGLKINVSKVIELSFFLSNPSKQMLVKEFNEPWPGRMKTSLKFHFSRLFKMSAVIEKHNSKSANLKIGIIYSVHKKVVIKSGYNSLNQSFSAGVGMIFQKIDIHIATHYNIQTSFSPSLSMVYKFNNFMNSEN